MKQFEFFLVVFFFFWGGDQDKLVNKELKMLVSSARASVSNLFLLSPGELTLEEFISGAREHPDIMDMLSKMMDLTHVLEIILKGQRRKAVN